MGFLFLILYPGFSSSLPPPASRLPPPPPHITTQSFITHPLSHTLFDTIFHTHHLSHTISHIIFHIPSFTHHLLHTPSFTHHLCHPSLSISLTHTHLCQPPLRGRRGTWRHVPSFHVAGVALGDMCLHFTWQAWHLWHWAGSGGALFYTPHLSLTTHLCQSLTHIFVNHNCPHIFVWGSCF